MAQVSVLSAHRASVRPFQASGAARNPQQLHQRLTIVCQANNKEVINPGLARRQLLLAGSAALTVPLLGPRLAWAEDNYVAATNLSVFQKADERAYFQSYVTDELKKVLTAEDAKAVLRLILNDAGTYDAATGTGGFNGSIQFELDRPENKGLKRTVDKLLQAKKAIDAESAKQGSSPITFVDLETAAGKVATRQLWRQQKIERAKVASGGETIADQFGANWPIYLGREDATGPDPEGRIPARDAPVAELKEWFRRLGNKSPDASGFGAARAPFWDRPAFLLWASAADDTLAEEARWATEDPDAFKNWKNKYDRSRKTVTRTDYEVDFIEYYEKLTGLGAKFDRLAYLHPIKLEPRKL